MAAAAETSTPSLTRRKLSFRNRWRSRKNVGDDGGGTVLRRSQSAKEVRGICHADSLSIRSPVDVSGPSNVEKIFSEKIDPKKEDSTTNLFRTFRLKRTLTLSSIVATWNKSIRINKRKSQSFRHLENFFTSFDQRYIIYVDVGEIFTFNTSFLHLWFRVVYVIKILCEQQNRG